MDCKKVEQKIIKFIQNQVKVSKTNGAVIGISGGVDSAVTAVLAIRALGTKNVLGLILPCHSQSHSEKDAMELIKKFNIRYEKIDLTEVYNIFLKRVPIDKQKAEANLRSRLRMCSIYYMANNYNYLVLGTSNKTEILVGYFTKFGDGGVDIEPIGDLYKKDIYEMASYLNIPESIINKAPTADLWVGQTDEGEMGITYKELDEILIKFSKRDILIMSKLTNKEKKVEKMISSTIHKRSIAPICTLN